MGPSYTPVALRYWARLSSWPARRSLGRQEEVEEEREKYGGRREKRQDRLFAVVRGCARVECCGFVDVRRAVQRCSRQHHKTLEARPVSIRYYEASVNSESGHTLASFLSGSCTPRTNTITSRESVVDNSELNFKFKAQKMLRAVTHWQSHCDKLNEWAHQFGLQPLLLRPSSTMAASRGEALRQDALAKERAKAREEFERQKEKLISETEKARPSTARFVGQNDTMEDFLKKQTVGLVRLEDFQQKRKEIEEAKAREAAKTDELKYVLSSGIARLSVV